MLRRIFNLLAVMLGALTLVGCDTMFYETKGGGEAAYALEYTRDGGYIMAGRRDVDDLRSDALLVKTDALGSEEWSQAFEIEGSSLEAYSVQQTEDGGYITAGKMETIGYDNAFLIKTDDWGNGEWQKILGGDLHDSAFCVQQTSDGGFIMAGHSWSYGDSYGDAWLLKTDPLGNEEWSQVFKGDTNYARSVRQTADGGYIISGGYGDAWLLKTDALGNEEWLHIFEEKGSANSVQQTPDGGFITILSGTPYAHSPRDLHLIKTDALGNEEWLQLFEGSKYDHARSIRQAADGGYILAGGSENAWLLKTDALGSEEWSQVFGEDARIFGHAVQQLPDGSFILAGSNFPRGATPTAFLIKADTLGNEEWAREFGEEFVAGHAPTGELFMLLLVVGVFALNAVYFLVFTGDMKARGENRPAWFVKFLFLAPFAAAWYSAYRKPKDGAAVTGNKFESLAKFFAIHWSIYIWLYPVIALILATLFMGPGLAFVGILLAALISGLVFIWFAVWLAPLSITLMAVLIATGLRSIKLRK